MSNTFDNILGTSNQSFQIGNDGVSIYQGVTPPPSNGNYVLGDIYLQCGPTSSTQTVWVYTNNGWTNILNATQDSVNLFQSLVGVPLPWPTNNVPQGFILHDGSSFDTNIYPLLAQRYPNGVITDLRGYFIRGLDSSGTVDNWSWDGKNRTVLSSEDGSYLVQDNTNNAHTVGFTSNRPIDLNWDIPANFPSKVIGAWSTVSGYWNPSDSSQIGVARPKNIAYNYISFTGKSLPNTSLSLYENNEIDFKNYLTMRQGATIKYDNTENFPIGAWVGSPPLNFKVHDHTATIAAQYDQQLDRILSFVGQSSSGIVSKMFLDFDKQTIKGLGGNIVPELMGDYHQRMVIQTFIATIPLGQWQGTITFPQAFAQGSTPYVFLQALTEIPAYDAGNTWESTACINQNQDGSQQITNSNFNMSRLSRGYHSGNSITIPVMAIGPM